MVSAKSLVPILTGPTATGKTSIALQFALENPKVEIVNADSMLVYREMDIGTAKPSTSELEQVPHHLINIRDPNESFTAGDFFRETEKVIEDIFSRGKQPIIVGGTGFYLKALLYGLWETPPADLKLRARLENTSNEELYQRLLGRDEKSALRIGVNDRYRLVRAWEIIEQSGKTPSELEASASKTPDSRFRLLVIDRTDDELKRRIRERTTLMLQVGLVEETQRLIQTYPNARGLDAVGYAQVCRYLRGIAPPGRKVAAGERGLQSEIELATRQLVKRQRTWLRAEKSAEWYFLERDQSRLWMRLNEEKA